MGNIFKDGWNWPDGWLKVNSRDIKYPVSNYEINPY